MKLPRLHVPLSAPGLSGMKYVQAIVALVSLLLLLTSAWFWKETLEVEGRIAELETAVAEARKAYQTFRRHSEAEGFDASPARLQALREEVAFANRVVRRQRFAWTQLLDDLERTTPQRISMQAIVLNKESLALSGAALTLEDLTAFVDQLKTHPAFHHVEIASHKWQRRSRNVKTGPATFLTFNLAVSYEPTQEEELLEETAKALDSR